MFIWELMSLIQKKIEPSLESVYSRKQKFKENIIENLNEYEKKLD